MNTTKHGNLLAVALLAGLTAGPLASGCGGGGGGGSGGDGTSGGEGTTVTAGGTSLTAEAENHWEEALTAYNTARTDGWTEAECASVIAGFERANSTQGGRFTEAVFMIGRTHDDCGHADQANEFYGRALEINQAFCGARVARGNAAYRAGRVDEARGEYERAVRDDTRCTEGYTNLAIIQRRNPSQAAEALQNLRRALAIDSSYLPAFNQMALLYYEQAVRQSGGSGSGVAGGVAAVSGAAASSSSSSSSSSSTRSSSRRTHSQMLDLAEVVCRQAQLIDGNYAPIYNTWGLINVMQGNIIAGLAKFERAFNLDPTMFEAYMNFGELTLGFRGYEDAAAAFTRATELRSETYDAWLGLGAARRGLNNPDDAQAAYERAIAIDATRPEAYYNIGLLWQDYRDGTIPTLNRATEYYNQFVSRAGSRPEYAGAVEGVTRRCEIVREGDARARARARRRARRRGGACAMGRLQQIEEAISTINDIAEMQRMAAEMEAANAAAAAELEREAAAEAAAAGVSETTPTPPAGGGGAAPPEVATED